MALRSFSHGSHPHPLVLYQRGGPCRYLNCSICQAVVDLQQDTAARRCSQCADFLLCAKCFDVEEHPFTTPQIVVRNPMLSRNDSAVAIRTRPRSSAYVLCPIHAGELIEVVAYAESKEDVGTVYFRQRVGGWVNSTHVVCVVPSERSIAVLAKLHIQYENQGHAAALPVHDAIECMEESITLLNENSSFGAVLSCLTFLPLQLYLTTASLAPSNDANNTSEDHHMEMEEFVFRLVEFSNFVLLYAAEELQSVIAKGPVVLGTDAGVILLVRLIGRALCCLWHIPSPYISHIPASVYPAVCTAAKTLTRLIAELRVSPGDPTTTGTSPKGTFPSSIFVANNAQKTLELWRAVQADNAAMDLKALRARDLSISLLEVVGHLMQDVPSFFLSFRPDDLAPLRNAVTLLSPMPQSAPVDDIATLLCGLSAAHLLHASENTDGRVLSEMQSALLDLDLIEVALKLIKGGRDEPKVIAGLECVSRICLTNPHIISITAAIVIPQVIHCLRTTQYDTVVNAAFDACTSLAFNSPQRPSTHRRPATREGDDPFEICLPFCSATLHRGSSPFQEMFLSLDEAGSCTALCAHCAQAHPPLQSGIVRHKRLPFGYFVCQCSRCAADSSGPCAPPPNIPLTSAQKILASNRILSVMTQRLRAHGWRVANAVGRLSMQICCSEEVAQALFCSLVEQQNLRSFADASLAVAACQYFSHVSCLIQTYSDSAISRYIRGVRDVVEQPPFEPLSSSLAHVERTPTLKSASHADPMGLTPSPSGGEAPPPRRYSGGSSSHFSSNSSELIAHR